MKSKDFLPEVAMFDLDKYYPVVLQGMVSNPAWSELLPEAMAIMAMTITVEAIKQFRKKKMEWDLYTTDALTQLESDWNLTE